VDGSFDDCQDLVKALFGDEAFRRRHSLSAVNSINWARVMAQIVYYVTAAREVNSRCGRSPGAAVDMAVPTGNFGNIFAGYAAARMGLSVGTFMVASNTNDILTRFFRTGTMDIRGVVPTLSPSMDIQVSSNLERLLFELAGRDGASVAEIMETFRGEGSVSIESDRMRWLSETFVADRLDDDECLAVMADEYRRHGRLIDPHSAVGIGVARRRTSAGDRPVISLGTAHPAKFPDAVTAATGVVPELPERLAGLWDLPERCVDLPADLAVLSAYVAEHTRAR
jgi:threonine synthase